MWHAWGRGEEFTVLVGRPEDERPLGRPRRRWEDNIKMDFFFKKKGTYSPSRTFGLP
jgi:hypothetical protein